MERMQCDCCGHVYDKDEGDAKNNVPAGTAWKDVPADYKCPECGSGKDTFIIEQFDLFKNFKLVLNNFVKEVKSFIWKPLTIFYVK